MRILLSKQIVLFDGMCNFCDWNVQFIMRHDPNQHFLFASLQSEIGKKLLEQYRVPTTKDSLILLDTHQYYTQSTAALKIARKLDRLYPCLFMFIIIPRPIRNLVYRFVANNRYKWFGKRTTCTIPTPQEKKRFLS